MTGTLARQAVRKARTDGIPATMTAAYREAKQTLSPPIAKHVFNHVELRDRAALRDEAVLRETSGTEYLPRKGLSGAPNRVAQAFYQPGDRFVTVVNNARIAGRRGLAIDESGRCIVDTVGPPIIVPRRPLLAIQAAIEDLGVRQTWGIAVNNHAPTKHIKRGALLLPPFTNYYHWTAGALMKIRLLRRYGMAHGFPPILVPGDAPGWLRETLKLVAYPGDIVSWDGRAATIGELVVPTYPDPVEKECGWLRQRMRAAANATPSSDRRLLVTREDSTRRRMANREAVIDALEPLGFEAVCPGDYSVEEQVRLFSRAEMVVGPHGAGLTNIVYADNAAVFELWANKQVGTFSRMSRVCGHDHYRLEQPGTNGDIVVDVDALTNEVQRHD